MQHFVVGFAFNADAKQVALIRKKRPSWQAGRLNGIGGKIETGEDPIDAMVREFYEETGVSTESKQWQTCAVLGSKPDAQTQWHMHVYSLRGLDLQRLKSTTDEQIEIHRVGSSVIATEGISNLAWLIPLALDIDLTRLDVRALYDDMPTTD
jgi:8-oxo-dGTP diphosphatase